ncbi:MAG TPA: hypothetical protein VGY76_09685 [Solirubrobacteraceae bacterium]|nr:hypothetical protein [Solirubrobacteraceae bacterium]
MLLFLPSGSDAIERELSSVPTLSTGLMSATQGNYTTAQFLLDITQGARVSYSAYDPAWPPTMSLLGDRISNWPQALRRASGAPQILQPGLLASAVPGGAAYAGIVEEGPLDSLVAAGRTGHITAVSLGPAATLPARVARLSKRYALVVADLPGGALGEAQLRVLADRRPPGQLLLVVQRAPDERGYELLWTALAGLGGGHALTSSTTNQRGLIAAIDIAPTILRHLASPIPAAMRGEPIRTDGAFDGPYLRTLKSRLAVVYSRRLPALAWLLIAWAALLLASLLPTPRDSAHRRAGAMRIGALALLWTPAAQLLPAALEPSRPVEFALLVLTCFALGCLTDRTLPWPRAPLAPALVAIVALSADALLHTQLLLRSLLGPNPIFGARFYGIGNELKSALAVLVFVAVAAWLYPAERGRRAATPMALAGILLAAIEGSARVGAGVGGVILVSAGTAVATVMLLPGRLTRRRALLILIAPAAGLLALVALDLATASGAGHFTGSILHARSAGDLRDVLERRYGAAYDELKHGAMPVATALGLIAAAIGLRRRERLLDPVAGDPAWLAALAGGLAAGVVGALTEDSGPVLFVVAVFVLICVLSYLWGKPPPSDLDATRRSAGTRRAGRSRARRPPPGALAR